MECPFNSFPATQSILWWRLFPSENSLNEKFTATRWRSVLRHLLQRKPAWAVGIQSWCHMACYKHAHFPSHAIDDIVGASKGLNQRGKELFFYWCIERIGNWALRKPTRRRNPGCSVGGLCRCVHSAGCENTPRQKFSANEWTAESLPKAWSTGKERGKSRLHVVTRAIPSLVCSF